MLRAYRQCEDAAKRMQQREPNPNAWARELATAVEYRPGWLTPAQAEGIQQQLVDELPWCVHGVRLFGREQASPRLSSWHGDADARYRYSGIVRQPQPWTPTLSALRRRLQDELAQAFNSVLANRYRHGQDSMGWHADDEPELGPEPLIASLSFGASRRFLLKPKRGGRSLGIELEHGSLLLMRSHCQRDYLHALPKTTRPVAERINLTFRWVAARTAG